MKALGYQCWLKSKRLRFHFRTTLLLFIGVVSPAQSGAAEISVAVASNFSDTIKVLAAEFERSSEHTVKLIFGSTGKHYAQIQNGAPFDLFFAADSKRPGLLEANGVAIAGSRYVYARGKLVLWSPNNKLPINSGEILQQQKFNHLAIANPKLAPYGLAAMTVLKKQNVWQSLQKKIVRGENIAQAFQFVRSGNADLGFIALSQITTDKKYMSGAYWTVPQSQYPPIDQQMVVLNDSPESQQFAGFIKSDIARKIIQQHGYDLPES